MTGNYNLTVNELIEHLKEKERNEWRKAKLYEASGRPDLALEQFEKFRETGRLINQLHLAVFEVGYF